MSLQGSLSIERMCALAQVSRASFYRSLRQQQPHEEAMEVRAAIQQIVVEHRRRYGYRRVAFELHQRGMQVNAKRVLRLLREDNLLSVQPRAFRVTTDSEHKLEVYLNLAARLELTGIDQLWVADITYIRLKREFVYLAVILDGFSRKVVGWHLSRTLTTELTLAALNQAISKRRPRPGLVHHSDRGVQYASADYVNLLRQHRIIPSMSRPANPYDNGSCESFIKTLKREEVDGGDYQDFEHLHGEIEVFIEDYYNRRRRHSALGYCSPEQFERGLESSSAPDFLQGARMSFFRHGEIFQSDVKTNNGEPALGGSPAHRPDESPAGYSLAGCSPAEPASASPAGGHREGANVD
jgi:transposase InsO family protein